MATAATDILRSLLVASVGLCVVVGVASCGGEQPKQAASEPDTPDQPADPNAAEHPQDEAHARVGLAWEMPSGWIRVDEFRASRLDTWKTPTDSDSVQAFAFWFGPSAGNSDEASLRRWGVQLRLADGSTPTPDIETWEANGLRFTVATFTGQTLTGMTQSELALGANGARLVGAIVSGGPEGNVFFRLSGPTGIVEELTPAFLDMVRSVRPLENTPAP